MYVQGLLLFPPLLPLEPTGVLLGRSETAGRGLVDHGDVEVDDLVVEPLAGTETEQVAVLDRFSRAARLEGAVGEEGRCFGVVFRGETRGEGLDTPNSSETLIKTSQKRHSRRM